MPVPLQRDVARTRERLAAWCASKFLVDGAVRIGAIWTPDMVGFANETLLFDATWRADDGGHTARLVARVASPTYRVYPEHRLDLQYAVLDAVGRGSDVPVPAVYGYEPDPDLLGGPFLVTSRVAGRVPPDLPSYHRAGWTTELSETDRATLWHSGVDVLGRIHRLDPSALGLVSPSEPTDPLAEYADRLDFFGVADEPVVGDALAWLRERRPTTVRPALQWGDARLGNLIFDGLGVAAVLDWEMTAIGPPEADLAWFLYLDRFLSEGIGVTRLAGLPDRAATIDRWSAWVGRRPEDLDHHEVFAGFRFALITARVTDLMVRHGIVPSADVVPLHRSAVQQLARTLDRIIRTGPNETGPSAFSRSES